MLNLKLKMLLLFVGLLLGSSGLFAQSTFYVSTTGRDQADGTEANPLQTIGAAITKANNSDTIQIGVGTYTESLIVNKELNIVGEEGKDVFVVSTDDVVVSVDSSNVSFKNIVLKKSDRTGNIINLGTIDTLSLDSVQLINGAIGLYTGYTVSTDTVTITNCLFKGNTLGICLTSVAIAEDEENVTNNRNNNWNITKTRFQSCRQKGFYAETVQNLTLDTVVFDDCANVLAEESYGNGCDINLYPTNRNEENEIVFNNVTFEKCGKAESLAIRALAFKVSYDKTPYARLDSMRITNCTFKDNSKNVLFEGLMKTNVFVQKNIFNKGIVSSFPCVDLSYNYWADTTNYPGQLYPYYADEAMTELVWDGANVIVKNANGEDKKAYKTFAEALDNVDSGGTIQIGALTTDLTDSVIIDKSITIVGVDSSKTIFKGDLESDESGLVIMGNVDVVIKNIRVTEVGGNQDNDATAISAGIKKLESGFTGKLLVENCTVDSFGKTGIGAFGGTLTVKNCFVDVGTHLPETAKNGIQVDFNAVGHLTGNTVLNTWSKSEWHASGILVCRGGKIETITGNTLIKCQDGISHDVLYDEEAFKGTSLADGAEDNNTFVECETDVKRTAFDNAIDQETVVVSNEYGYNDANDVFHYYPVGQYYNTLSEAIAKVDSGKTILVKSSTYQVTKPINLKKSLKIVGETNTIIQGVTTVNSGCFVIPNLLEKTPCVITIEGLTFKDFGGDQIGATTIILHEVLAKNVTLNVSNSSFSNFGKRAIYTSAGVLNVDNCVVDVGTNDPTRAKNGIQFEQSCVATITNSTFKDAKSESEWSATGILGLRGGKGTITGNTFTNCQKAIGIDNYYNYYYDNVGAKAKTQETPTPTTSVTEKDNKFGDCTENVSRNFIELPKFAVFLVTDTMLKDNYAGFTYNDSFYYYKPYSKKLSDSVLNTFSAAVDSANKFESVRVIFVDTGIHTDATRVVLKKTLAIVGMEDSRFIVIKNPISVTNPEAERITLDFSGLTIESAPDTEGMIDIQGSLVTLNTKNIKMINKNITSTGVEKKTASFGIVTNKENCDSVIINFIASEMELTRTNHRGIVALKGLNHDINLSNSYIHSPWGTNNLDSIYGVNLWTSESSLTIDKSVIDVNYYAVSPGNRNLKVNIKNSKLTGWAAVYLDDACAINPVIRIDSCELTGRNSLDADRSAVVVLRKATNANIVIHNSIIRQAPGTASQYVINSQSLTVGSTVALTGTTSLHQHENGGPIIWNTSCNATNTAGPTVKFYNSNGVSAIEARRTSDRNSDVLCVSSTMQPALDSSFSGGYVFGNDYPKTAEGIAAELTNTIKSGVTILNNDFVMSTSLDSAYEQFNNNKTSWYLKQTNENNKATFEAKFIHQAQITWALPAHVYYNTPITTLAISTSGDGIVYTVSPKGNALIAKNGNDTTITFLKDCTLTATTTKINEFMPNTASIEIVVEPAQVEIADCTKLEGVNDAVYTGSDVTTGWNVVVKTKLNGGSVTLIKGTDYTVVYNHVSGIQVTPIEVGEYVANIVLMGNYAYADKTNTLKKSFSITPKETITADLSIVTPGTFVYGTQLKDVPISCDRTKGTITWTLPDTYYDVGTHEAGYNFKATNKNYKDLTGITMVVVTKRQVQVVVQDSSIEYKELFTDSSYALVNYFKNDVDTFKDVILATDYSADSKIGAVARIFIQKADSIQTNQTFTVVEGKLYVGEPAIDKYAFKVAGEVYGTTLSNYKITMTSKEHKGIVRYRAGQENLIPTFAGMNVQFEYVLYGKVVATQDRIVSATKKTATIYVDTQYVTVKDPSPTLTSSVEGALAGENIIYSLSSSYSASNDHAGSYPINVILGQNPNYKVEVVKANVVSNQINMTNFIVSSVTATYNGTAQTAKYTIVYIGKTLVNGTDYTVENATTTNVGQLTSKITFKTRYIGKTTAIFDLKPVHLQSSILNTEAPYTGMVQKPQYLFKTTSGALVGFVKSTDYNVVDSDLKEIRNADSYIVKAISSTPNLIFSNASDTDIYTVLKLNASFTVKNATQTWAEELTKSYTATVNSNNSLMTKDSFVVLYGGVTDSKPAVTDSGVFQIWVRVSDPNFEWDETNTSLGFLTLNTVPVPEIFFNDGLTATIFELQAADNVKQQFVDISAQIVGTMLAEKAIARLNISGSAAEGINYTFENGKKHFEFTRSKKSDTIRVIIKDDGAVTPNLFASFSLIAQTENTIIRTTEANYVLTIETIQKYEAVTTVGFTNKKEEIARAATNSFAYGINGTEGIVAYVKVSGAKANDIALRDQNGHMILVESRGYPVAINAGNVGLFTMEIINNDLIKPGATKTITLTLAKVVSSSTSLLKIDTEKRSTKLIIRNTSPIAFSDEFGYESAEAKELPAGNFEFTLDVLRNDQPFINEEVTNAELFVSGVRQVGAANFATSTKDNFGGTLSIGAEGTLLYTFNNLDSNGFTTTFEYELSQLDAGVSIGALTLTIAPSMIRGQPAIVLVPETSRKPSMYATYLDPNSTKASTKNKLKKITLSSKVVGNTVAKSAYSGGRTASGAGVEVFVKSNVKSYNSKLLSQTQKAGVFTSSMYNQDSELIYTPVATSENVKRAKTTVDNTPKVLQGRKLGMTIMMKNHDSEISAFNITPALNVKMTDTVLSSDGEVLRSNIMVVNKTTNAFTLEGDYFGPSPKFFLEYHNGKQIKKITLPCKRSISFVNPKTGMKATLKRGTIIPGKGQQEWILMPSSVEKMILKGTAQGGRFDLVIDNGSMLTILPNFNVESIINFNRN